MDLVSLSPLRVASVLWQPRAGAHRLTVVAKATFELFPGESRLAEAQEDLNEDDNHWNDDPARSLYSPSDMSPFKMRADVLLVGHAFAPRGEPVRSLVARVLVAEMDKAVEVFGNRASKTDEPAPFARMPIRYERAAGGPDTMNPVGVGDGEGTGGSSEPNVVLPGGVAQVGAGGFVEPIGFGPIAPSWPLRRAQLGRHGGTWSRTTWNRAPLPEDIELGYFNAAPRDQQVEAIRDNERILLENLHPEHGQLVTRLPGVHPRAFVERARGPEELVMRGDTLWIDTDRGLCTLTFRGQVALDSPAEVGRVLVAMEDARQRITWPDVERLAASRAPKKAAPEGRAAKSTDARPTLMSAVAGLGDVKPEAPRAEKRDTGAQPIASGRGGTGIEAVERGTSSTSLGIAARFMATPAPPLAPGGGALTGRRRPLTGPPPPPEAPVAAAAPPREAPPAARPAPVRDLAPPRVPMLVDEPSLPTMDLTATHLASALKLTAALPFTAPAPGAPSFLQQPDAPPPAKPARIRHRPVDDATATEEPPGLSSAMPAWLAPGSAPHSARELPPQPQPPPPRPASERAAPMASQERAREAVAKPSEPPPAPPAARATPRPAVSRPVAAEPQPARPAAAEGAARFKGMSAGETTEVSMAGRRVTAEIVELLHVDTAALLRLRGAPGFAALLDAGARVPGEDEPTADVGVQARRQVYGVLARGVAVDVADAADAVAVGVAADGTYTPPVLLVAAELEVGFSEVEVLRATLLALEPLLPRDVAPATAEHALREAVELASAWLGRLGSEGASSVAEALTQRIRDAVARAASFVPPGYLEAHTERTVLERRAYQTRPVLGDRWIRAQLMSPATDLVVPAYLPLSAAARLPLFTRFSARAVVEAHPRQDQFEGHPSCLRILALGRRLPPLPAPAAPPRS